MTAGPFPPRKKGRPGTDAGAAFLFFPALTPLR